MSQDSSTLEKRAEEERRDEGSSVHWCNCGQVSSSVNQGYMHPHRGTVRSIILLLWRNCLQVSNNQITIFWTQPSTRFEPFLHITCHWMRHTFISQPRKWISKSMIYHASPFGRPVYQQHTSHGQSISALESREACILTVTNAFPGCKRYWPPGRLTEKGGRRPGIGNYHSWFCHLFVCLHHLPRKHPSFPKQQRLEAS